MPSGRLVLVILALAAAGAVATILAFRAGAERGPSPAAVAPAGGSGGVPLPAAAGARNDTRMVAPALLPLPPPGAPPPAAEPTVITLPIPPSLGGGKHVAPGTREVATRLGLVPEDLTDVADARGGSLPPPVTKRLDDAYARGVALGDRLAVTPPNDEIVGNRFANQLVRIDREMRRSPPSTKLADVVDAVTRDTIADLRRNVGDEVADAAKPELLALQPL
jgi:hypothetical protein